jgi:eukaryotic-like serine/threonine-protein kinase
MPAGERVEADRVEGTDLVTHAVEREEHAGRVGRMRAALRVALVAWPAFAFVDWFLVTFVHPGRLSVYLAARLLGLVAIVLGAVRLSRGMKAPGARGLRALDTGVFTALCAFIALPAIECGGLESPLALGVCTLLVARTAVLGDHFRLSLLPVGLGVAAYPVVVGLTTLVSPEIVAQLRNRQAVATFALSLLFLGGAAALTLVGGQLVWRLRREVFETRSLGRYRVKSRIGKGGMGEIWIAHHVTLGRDVALKILHPDLRRDPEATARFAREVRTTAELRHPNTIRIFDHGVTEAGLCYYAMELLDGVDLASLVHESGPLDPVRGIGLVLQASRALAEAHRLGIVHRDVKPQNIFVARVPGDPREFVKVLDFGLARFAASDDAEPITVNGFAVGTPSYISPEVLKGHPADARSDVYALGGLLYFVLRGAPPFPGRESNAVLRAHLTQPPPRLGGGEAGDFPDELEQIVARCLHKNPTRRFIDAGELTVALERLVGLLPPLTATTLAGPRWPAAAARTMGPPDEVSSTREIAPLAETTAAPLAPPRAENDTVIEPPRTSPRTRR